MIKNCEHIKLLQNIHDNAIIFDGHCDTVLELARKKRLLPEGTNIGHLDIPRMKEGGLNVQIFAVFIEELYKPKDSLKRTLQLIDCIYRYIENNKKEISIATNYKQIMKALSSDKIAAIISIEGGEALEGDLGILKILYKLGVRLLTLTWNQRNQIGDGIGEQRTKSALTEFGLQVIDEMNNLGMLVDVSHLSENCFWDVIDRSKDPIVASHSNCFSLCPNLRNLKDQQIEAIAKKNGIIGVNYVPDFLINKKEVATVKDVVNHIEYIARNVGVDYVGLGSDFDGTVDLPLGLEGVNKIPNITEELARRGFSEQDIRKILGENWIRVFKKVVK